MSTNEKKIEKYYNEKGEVAVLYSPGFGAGWSTWADDSVKENVLFNKIIVELVLNNKHSEITNELCESLFGSSFYVGGAHDLEVKFLRPGTQFIINEYDGNETIDILDEIQFHVA
jgi:hypothetical protein